MTIRNILLILLLFNYWTSSCQELEFDEFEFVNIESNKTEYIYATTTNELLVLNLKGEVLRRYSNMQYGPLSSIDVSDPLKLLLFYKESNMVIMLNKQLAEINSPVIIDDIAEYEAKLVCRSNKGGFWIYDELSQSVIYINAGRITELQSQSINSLTDAKEPLYIFESDSKVLLTMENGSTLVFDAFATYLNKLYITVLSNVISQNNTIQFWDGICYTNYNFLSKSIEPICNTEYNKAVKVNSKWVLLKNKKIYIADSLKTD